MSAFPNGVPGNALAYFSALSRDARFVAFDSPATNLVPADTNLEPDVFVCGPTGFVEAVADFLVDAGHDPRRIRTERFGPTGG